MPILGVRLRRLPAALFALTVVLELAGVALLAGLEPAYDTVLYAFLALALGLAGALVASRYPDNPIGWLFLVSALSGGVSELAQGYGRRGALEGWPAASELEWLGLWSWLPSALSMVLIFLLFPDGRFLTPRWRWVAWAAALGVLVQIPGWSLSSDRGREFALGVNPIVAEGWLQELALVVGMVVFFAAWAAAAVALLLRFRRSRGEERQQMKVFVFAALLAGTVLPIAAAVWDRFELARVAVALVLAGVPAAACVAILRHRLYDIDVVINRTVVYTLVSLALAAAYAATAFVDGHGAGRRLGAGDRGGDARGRGGVPPGARAGAGRGRPPVQRRPLRRAPPRRGVPRATCAWATPSPRRSRPCCATCSMTRSSSCASRCRGGRPGRRARHPRRARSGRPPRGDADRARRA